MARKTEAYVDTSALIAFRDRSDTFHPLFRRLFSDPPPLVTSALVVAEGHGWFLRRYDSARAVQFLNFVEELPMLVYPFDGNELAKSTRLIKKFSDQNLTLADAHGLAVMQSRRNQACWSTDRHLQLTGVPLVI
ncbi:MAG: PIN domain-containing protein [Bryobacteraceae bacterium]|jgi:predicted nucleic acid-binding protein